MCDNSHAVPIAPPQDVQVNNITSNSVIISWNEPDVDFHNGIIRYYAVHASPKSLEVDSIVRTTSERKLKMVGLHPFTTYDVKVIAFTVGLGPASDTITFRTMEAGKNIQLCVMPMSFDYIYSSLWRTSICGSTGT